VLPKQALLLLRRSAQSRFAWVAMLALFTACETGHPAAYELAMHQLGEAPELITNQIDLNGNGRNELLFALVTRRESLDEEGMIFSFRHRGMLILEPSDTGFSILMNHRITHDSDAKAAAKSDITFITHSSKDVLEYWFGIKNCTDTTKQHVQFSLIGTNSGASDPFYISWSQTNRRFEERSFYPCKDQEILPSDWSH
jgi:hypothetical protein